METTRNEILSYYAKPGPLTYAGKFSEALRSLPVERHEMVPIIQSLAVHIFWVDQYGLKLSKEREAEVNLRSAQEKLEQLLVLDSSPLTTARPLERRLICNCRDFSLLSVAVLCAHGLPARARCGFGVYFLPNHFEDHWVCEVWDEKEKRWVWFDPQIDALMNKCLALDFDPLDMPAGKFITGGEAWLLCRKGQANPDNFGIFQWHGWDFVRGNLFRDLLALNHVEVLPWDMWGPLSGPSTIELGKSELELLDRIAYLTTQPDEHFHELRAIYEQHPEFHFSLSTATQD